MAGVRGRSGRYPKAFNARRNRLNSIELGELAVNRELQDLIDNWDNIEAGRRLEIVSKLAMPLKLKGMTDKQAVLTLTASLELSAHQVAHNEFIVIILSWLSLCLGNGLRKLFNQYTMT